MVFFPTQFDLPYEQDCNQHIYTSYALQRSGQHLIISWICRGLLDVIHLNHCRFTLRGKRFLLTPKTGRRIIYSNTDIMDSGRQGKRAFRKSLPDQTPMNLFYSIEDKSCFDPFFSNLTPKPNRIIIILRDPANWLASTMEHGRSSKSQIRKKIAILIEFLKVATRPQSQDNRLIFINYNTFVNDFSYREKLANSLNLVSFELSEKALSEIPHFGGGSSFKTTKKNSNTLERWKNYEDNKHYLAMLDNQELKELSMKYWKNCPGFVEFNT